MLTVKSMHAYYGKSHVLQGVDIDVGPAQIATLLGRNGAGKTTSMRCIAGALAAGQGEILLDGKSIRGLPAHKINRLGLALVPEHRGVFTMLSVEENLTVALRPLVGGWTLSRVYELFPRLAERRRNDAGKLSGGEQQMLSIGRALLTQPRMLLLDEPTEGLAPVIVKLLVETFKTIRQTGVSILMVEQNLKVCAELADRHHVIESGRSVFAGTYAELQQGSLIPRYLGVET